MTKFGLLVECGRDGLEVVVCRKICQLLASDHDLELEVEIVPMDNKPRLLEECGTAAKNLLANKCERVVILWDERPAWPKMGDKLCWFNDRRKILAELQQAEVPEDSVHLVCIEREFESWLLYDERMLSCVLSKPTHTVRLIRQSNPDTMPNPKAAMTTLVKQNGGGRYVDMQFARRFADCLTSLSRLRKCQTFKRFERRALGKI